MICQVAVKNQRPVRIGVNGGSLNQELVMARMQENTDQNLGLASDEIINECMVTSALQSTELAIESGTARRSNHHFVQGFAAAAPASRSTATSRARRPSPCIWASLKPAWVSRAWRGPLQRWRLF